ncbi:hypothetical protein ACVBEG_27705 [Pseudomonas sp. GG8]
MNYSNYNNEDDLAIAVSEDHQVGIPAFRHRPTKLVSGTFG